MSIAAINIRGMFMNTVNLNEKIEKTVYAVQSINKVIEQDFVLEDEYKNTNSNNYVKNGLLVAVELITESLKQSALSDKE